MSRTGVDAEARLAVNGSMTADAARQAVRAWLETNVPPAWLEAGRRGGPAEVRTVRPRAAYEEWYPVFGASGLVVPTWPVEYGGLDLTPDVARAIEVELGPFNLGRLNPLGLNLAAPALFAHGTEPQRLRYLPAIVRNEERWCQLFSEPGSGSDLASLSTRAEPDGDEWVITGQKVWTTWAHVSTHAVLLARTDPGVLKREGITYFLLDLRQRGVDVRPLRHIGGEVDFNEVFLDGARVADAERVGEVGNGWKVANATLSGERQMVSGAGSGGVDRIGGSGADALVRLAKRISADGRPGGWDDPVRRDAVVRLWSEEQIRSWTNQRVRAQLGAGRSPGPESSIGKVHQGELNQRIQLLAVDMLGAGAMAWTDAESSWSDSLPHEVKGMLRSRANTIEGGTTEVNKNILGERVLGLPREADPWSKAPWRDVPRSG
jgi:alkylation response protein AidB-like acyl-CoA dehydrogenase